MNRITIDDFSVGHDWGDWTKLNDNEHQRICKRDASHTETASHVWNEGVVTKEPTCKEQGSKFYTCTVCDATKTKPIAIDPDNHADYGTHLENVSAATCLEAGYTGDTVCNGCGATLAVGETIDPLGPNVKMLNVQKISDWQTVFSEDPQLLTFTYKDNKDDEFVWIAQVTPTPGLTQYRVTDTLPEGVELVDVKVMPGPNIAAWNYGKTDYPGTLLAIDANGALSGEIGNLWMSKTIASGQLSTDADGRQVVDITLTANSVNSDLFSNTFYVIYYCELAEDAWPTNGTEQLTLNNTVSVETNGDDYGQADNTIIIDASNTQDVVNSYEVKFLDEDGTELKTQTVAYGSAATAPADPSKADDENKHYEFSGWDNDFSNITGDLTVTATYAGEAHISKEVVTVPATCTESGEKELRCKVCNRVLDTQPINPLGHDWGAWSASGENHIRPCQRDGCNATQTEAHAWTKIGETSADCTNSGSITWRCDVCGAQKTETVDPNGHQLIKTEAVAATCLGDGNSAYYACSVCGKFFSDEARQNEIAKDSWVIGALDHDWGTWVKLNDNEHQRVCKRDSSHVETAVHVWSEWETVTAPTYDENGLEKRFCTVCAAEETRPINKLQSWTVTFVVDDADGTFEYEGKTYTIIGNPVRFTSVDDVINPPAVPTLEGFVGQWQAFTLTENDLIVPAIYTKKADTEESELETSKESNYANGIAEITLDAFARTNNVKTELGAKPYDIVLVVDQSGSMAYVMNEDREPSARYGETAADTRNAKLKGVANSFVDMVAATGLDHRIAIVGFGMASKAASGISAYQNTAVLTPGKTQYGLNQNMRAAYENAFVSVKTDKAIVTNAINGIQAKGATAADLGFEMAKGILANADSNGRKRLVIFLTDGEPTYNNNFEDDVANRTVNYSYLLKNVYGASVYSIAISGKANPEDEARNFNRFLHQTSSNYPFAKFGESGAAAPKKSYYYATTDATELENIFKDVFASTVSNTISFDKVTLCDTISKYFTMTVSQEEALRASLKAEYGVTQDDVVITRKEDGTTSLSICVAPKAVFENNIQTGYGATVTFRVSANENAVEAGYYDTNTADAGVLDGNGNQVASFEIPKVYIPQNRVFVTFKAGDEIYEIRDVRADEEIIAPQSSIGVWHIEPGTTVTENGTVFEAVLNSNERIIKWNTGSDAVVQSYKIGQLIYAPPVDVPESMSFSGWDNPVPNRMPTTNLEFTATFTPHTHAWKKVDTSGNCESGMTTTYRCVCGETKEEITAPTNHAYTAIITRELDESVVTMTCSVCGAYTTQYINYQTQYDKENKDRWGRPVSTTTTSVDLTLYNAQNVVIQPDADKPITVYVPITAEQKAAKDSLKVYRIEEGNRKTRVDAEVVNDYVVLHLDHFSYYLISVEETLPTYRQTVCAIHGHSYTDTVISPTCTERGYTTHTCASCSDTYTDNETAVDSANHAAYGSRVVNAKTATCKADGYTDDMVCNGCGATLQKGTVISKATVQHSLTYINANAATTEAEGNVEYYHCTVCGKNYSDANGTKELTKVTTDKLPKQVEPTTQKPDDSGSKPKGDCKYCGETHIGPFGWLIRFFHSILALFGLHK